MAAAITATSSVLIPKSFATASFCSGFNSTKTFATAAACSGVNLIMTLSLLVKLASADKSSVIVFIDGFGEGSVGVGSGSGVGSGFISVD